MFISAQNNFFLNNYNPIFTIKWLANVDISFCTNQKAMLHYVSKYCSKAKFKTAKLKDIIKNFIL